MKGMVVAVVALAGLCGAQAASAQDGRQLYAENCAECHGPEGRADTEAGRERHVPSLAGRKLTREAVIEYVRSTESHRSVTDVVHENELAAIAMVVADLSK